MFASDYEGPALEQVWSVCSLFSVSKPPRGPQPCTGGGSWPEIGFDFFFQDISAVNTALVEAAAACCIQQNILCQNTKFLPPQIAGQCFIPGLLPTCAAFAASQLSVLSHRTTHESHRILVMAFKPCIVGCLWHSCICFRDLF